MPRRTAQPWPSSKPSTSAPAHTVTRRARLRVLQPAHLVAGQHDHLPDGAGHPCSAVLCKPADMNDRCGARAPPMHERTRDHSETLGDRTLPQAPCSVLRARAAQRPPQGPARAGPRMGAGPRGLRRPRCLIRSRTWTISRCCSTPPIEREDDHVPITIREAEKIASILLTLQQGKEGGPTTFPSSSASCSPPPSSPAPHNNARHSVNSDEDSLRCPVPRPVLLGREAAVLGSVRPAAPTRHRRLPGGSR